MWSAFLIILGGFLVGGCLVRHNWSSIVVFPSCFIKKDPQSGLLEKIPPTNIIPFHQKESKHARAHAARFHRQHLQRVRSQYSSLPTAYTRLFHATVSFKSGPSLFSAKGSFLLSTAWVKKKSKDLAASTFATVTNWATGISPSLSLV